MYWGCEIKQRVCRSGVQERRISFQSLNSANTKGLHKVSNQFSVYSNTTNSNKKRYMQFITNDFGSRYTFDLNRLKT